MKDTIFINIIIPLVFIISIVVLYEGLLFLKVKKSISIFLTALFVALVMTLPLVTGPIYIFIVDLIGQVDLIVSAAILAEIVRTASEPPIIFFYLTAFLFYLMLAILAGIFLRAVFKRKNKADPHPQN